MKVQTRSPDVEDDGGSEGLLRCHSSAGRKEEEKTNHGCVGFQGLKKPASCDVSVAAVEARGNLRSRRDGGGLGFARLHPYILNRPLYQKKMTCRASPRNVMTVGFVGPS